MQTTQAVKRPERQCPEVVEHVANELAKFFDASDVEGVVQDLQKALSAQRDWDGYQIAKHLDWNFGWGINSLDVSNLDQADILSDSKYDEIVKQWVIDNSITPQFAIGDNVTFASGHRKEHGEIVEIRGQTGIYCICCEHLNQVRDLARPMGCIVGFESVIGKV